MMQTFRLSDVLRCILLNAPKGPNLACPREALTGAKPLGNTTLWKETLAQRRDRVTVAQWDGLRLGALAAARVRGGHRAWEIDRLFLAGGPGWFSANGQGQRVVANVAALELFERAVEAAGELRAERLFLRVPSKSPIVVLARQAGFFPYFEETLLEGRAGPSQGNRPTAPFVWQELSPEDHYPLFQLYCAATPQPVRVGVGLTFEQWRDAQETRRRRRVWVAKTHGRVIGSLGISKRGLVTGVEALAQPNDPELWEALLERALEHEGVQRWLVPDYMEEAAGSLLRRGFRELARYNVMVKTVVVPVARPGMAAVEA